MQGPNKWVRNGGGALLASLVLASAAGCSSRISNLTPSVLPREKSGLYRFEAQWTSNQRSVGLRSADIRGFVVMEQVTHPMERVSQMTNRWEAQVPLPKDRNPVFYFYKWEYDTAGFGQANPNSVRSPQYRLEVVGDQP